MKKRILSLGLSLSMLVSLLAATTNIAYAAAKPTDYANELTLKYYKDCTKTTDYKDDLNPTWELKNQIASVGVGEEFYAAVEMRDVMPVTAAMVIVEYDTSKVELLNQNGEAISQGLYTGFADGARKKHNTDGMYCIGNVNPLFNNGKVRSERLALFIEEATPEISTKDGYATVMRQYQGAKITDKSLNGAFVIFRFRAIAAGDAGIKMDSRKDPKYQGFGIDLQSPGWGKLTSEQYKLIHDDFVIKNADSKQLDKPENVKIDGRKVTWNVVTGAGSYKVAVEGSNGTKEEYTATANSFDIPEADFNACKVTVRVRAVSADSTVGPSDWSEEVGDSYKIKLETPKPVWGENKVTWKPVDKAVAYKVVITKNGAEIINKEVTGCELTVDFKETGETVDKCTYVAKVTALGNEYAENSDEGKTEEKNIFGSVSPVSNLKWDGTIAKWTASPDADKVAEYRVQVFRKDKHEAEAKIKNTTDTSIDLAEFVKNPGEYIFMVTAIGKNDYGDSKTEMSGVKLVTTLLKQVSNLRWEERVLSWDDENENSLGYNVKI